LAAENATHMPALTITSVSSNKGACRSAACQLKLERTRAFTRSVGAGMRLEMLGNSSSWRGWLWMSLQYDDHASKLSLSDPEHLVVAMDSSDGVVQAASEAQVVEAYRQVVAEALPRQQLVMALETGCVPSSCVPVPSIPTPSLPGNRHINGGFVMGPARLMHAMWHAVATTNLSCCKNGRMDPQLGMGMFALRYPELVAFDVKQRLAAIINLRDGAEFSAHYRVERGYVTNVHTGVQPAFLHFPGQQFPASWQTYRDMVLRPRGLLSSQFAEGDGASGRSAARERLRPRHVGGLAAWPMVRASACTARPGERVIFLLTSTPLRAARMGRVLENMRAQTRRPDLVLLTVPRRYTRPPLSSMDFVLAPAVARDPLLRVMHVDRDAGPLTKYFGSTMLTAGAANGNGATTNDAIVVVGDDDVWYESTFIEDFACAVGSSLGGAVFSSGRDTSCGAALGACVMGFRGIGLRASMLRDLPSVPVPPECFLADDVLITHHFQKRGFVLTRLRTRSRYQIDGAYAWTNESINAIHKRHGYKINRECVDRLVPGGSMNAEKE